MGSDGASRWIGNYTSGYQHSFSHLEVLSDGSYKASGFHHWGEDTKEWGNWIAIGNEIEFIPVGHRAHRVLSDGHYHMELVDNIQYVVSPRFDEGELGRMLPFIALVKGNSDVRKILQQKVMDPLYEGAAASSYFQ